MNLRCLKDEPLAKFTTFRIGGNAERLFLPESKEELLEILNGLDLETDNPVIIGAGSNILVSSQGYKGTVIVTTNLDQIYLENEETVIAQAGLKSPLLAKFCQKHNLSGLEFLAGIPGTLGGAVFMNCSANGQCISETLLDAEVINIEEQKTYLYSKEKLGLEYRKSLINPSKEIIVSARFRLKKADPLEISQKIEYNLNFRKNKHPKGLNAGSMFKNPGSDMYTSAGYLLDKVGAKSWHEGGAEVSTVHANFINNINDATSLDVSRLLLRMYNEVQEKFNYKLYPEVKYIGEPTEEEEKIWKILTAK